MLNLLLVQQHEFIIHITMLHMWHQQSKAWQTKFSLCGPLLGWHHKKLKCWFHMRQIWPVCGVWWYTTTLIRISFFYPNWMDTYTLYTHTYRHTCTITVLKHFFFTQIHGQFLINKGNTLWNSLPTSQFHLWQGFIYSSISHKLD